MIKRRVTEFITYAIAAVWLINGLFCKVLNLAPRHEQIVGEILGNAHSRVLTFIIGMSEIVMAVWIWSGYERKLNAITQIIVIGLMNILEFLLVPELLLWGKWNAVFALLFMLLIYTNEFHLRPHTPKSV